MGQLQISVRPDTACSTASAPQRLDARQLVDDLAVRAAEGEFASSGRWLVNAVDCLEREPERDSFDVVRRYQVTPIDSTRDRVRYLLALERVGYVTGAFHRVDRVRRDTVVAYKTTYGWRLRSPTPSNWISLKAALSQGWLQPTDTVQARVQH
jgi:hypothetical protein